MKQNIIYRKHWLDLHPYEQVQPSDDYYVDLANRLFGVMELKGLALDVRARMALYLAAYLEDQVSDLRLWQTFLNEHKRLYGRLLPFYSVTDASCTDLGMVSADSASVYYPDEVNREDVAFILWNTIQKSVQHGIPQAGNSPFIVGNFVDPHHPHLLAEADRLYAHLEKAYEEAPSNEALAGVLTTATNEGEGRKKLHWLFGHTYLTEPSVMPYLANMEKDDLFIIPTGPLALFLHEWIDALGGDQSWQQVKGLYLQEPELPADYVERNRVTYAHFTAATQGSNIVFLENHEALKHFLVEALHWPNDANHTFPQLSTSRDFILMVNPEKGMLLAKDICRYLKAPMNPLYDAAEAAQGAFRLLTEETLCPPDLLYRSIEEGWLPDLQVPGHSETQATIVENADFIARHFLLYYYRGD